MRILGIVLTIATSGLLVCHGFPGKLSEQRYEFQQRSVPVEFEEDNVAITPEYVVQEVVAPEFQPSPKWSQLHPNEVSAFAEVYRQNYNHLVEEYNRMFGLQYGFVIPVQYQLFNLPMGYSWQNYFGSQQQYVHERTEEMSRQLFYQIQNGTIAQQDLEAPSFFINQAANLLDNVHGHEQVHEQEAVPPQETLHKELETGQSFNERDHEKVLAFNPATGTYEYVYIQKTFDEEKSSDRVENARTSYIQSLPPVQFNNRAAHRDIESSESLSESATTQSTVKTTTDNYYAVTQRFTTEPTLPRSNPTPGKRFEVSRNIPLYSAPLAPFPVVVHESNPYYSAPLAPFPGEVHVAPTQVQAVQFSELDDMNQEHVYPGQQIIIPGHEDIHQDTQILEQVPDELMASTHDQFALTHVLGWQQEEHQQKIVAGPVFPQQYLDKQQPPEQAYRNPDLGVHQVAVPVSHDEEPAQPPVVTTSAPIPQEHHQKPWLQRQWSIS